MRKLILLALNMCMFLGAHSMTIDVLAPGTLSSLIAKTDKDTLTTLVVTGNIDARDIKCFRDEMPKLTSLDISNVVIKSYSGSDGPVSSLTTYPENELPQYSFRNIALSPGTILLKSIILPNTITSIGDYAFQHCRSLAAITIPNTVKSINVGAFGSCYGLVNVSIPNSVTTIGSYAFSACSYLPKISIPNSVTSIGDNAFSYCRSLSNLALSNSITSIESYTFYNCPLSAVSIPNKVTKIGNSAFYNCSTFTDLNIPNSVTSIEANAFYNCSSILNLTFGNSLKSLGNNAFYNCFKIYGNINLPTTLTSIGSYCFYNCNNISNINITPSITTINNNTFENCNSLSNIVLPPTISNIGNSAFYNCKSLVISTLPNALTKIGNNAFCNCLSFKGDLIIPNEVLMIGDNAFNGCKNIEKAIIGSKTSTIGLKAFQFCENLKEFNIDSNNLKYSSTEGVLLNKDQSVLICYPMGKTGNVILPTNVSIIGDYAFNDSKNIISLNIPNSVKSINTSAFQSCTNLTNVIIPNSITTIGDYAFSDCTGITSISFGNSLKTIGNAAFFGTNLKNNLIIPDSVISIGKSAFYNCSDLTNITLKNTNTLIGENAFWGCVGFNNNTNNIPTDSITKVKYFKPLSVYICPHQDDLAKYMGYNMIKDYTADSSKIVAIFITNGDETQVNNKLTAARNEAARASINFIAQQYSLAARINKTDTIVVNGHKIERFRYLDFVSYFLNLPCGSSSSTISQTPLGQFMIGTTLPLYNFNKSSSYKNWEDLKTTVDSLVFLNNPNKSNNIRFNTFDYYKSFDVNFHPDHNVTGLLIKDIAKKYIHADTRYFLGDYSLSKSSNITPDDIALKVGMYTYYDITMKKQGWQGEWTLEDYNIFARSCWRDEITPNVIEVPNVQH